MTKEKLLERLESLVQEADSFSYGETYGSSKNWAEKSRFDGWISRASDTLERGFPAGSAPSELSAKAETAHMNISRSGGQEAFDAALATMRQALVEGVRELEEEFYVHTSTRKGEEVVESNKVFAVHGHDNELKIEVARFIESIGLEAVILHEQASSGSSTIIEKIEDHSNVGFAVVLLTPDDVGMATSLLSQVEEGDISVLNYRARQNVILELGYFIGLLGRERVAALHKGDLELPSDYHGVLFISAESGDWRLPLAKELKVAGLEVDLNDAIRA